jgi:hypothetical protein
MVAGWQGGARRISAGLLAFWGGAVVTLLLLAGCRPPARPVEAIAPAATPVRTYPSWFVAPGPALGATAVGYAQVGLKRAEAESAAVNDARVRLALARRVRLELDAAYESGLGVSLTSQGERFREAPLDPVPDSVRLLASEAVRGLLLVLVTGTRESVEAPGGGLVALDSLAPSWVRELPRAEGLVYALGVAPATFREAAGWMEAERHGRVQLAASVSTRVRTLAMGAGRDEATVTTVSSAVTLADVAVQGRWRDGQTCFVLMRGRVLEAR